MNGRGKLDVISYKSRIFTTNEQKLCITYRDIKGIVYSLTKYEHINIGSDRFRKNLTGRERNLSYFTKKRNLSPIFCTAQMQLTKIQKLRIIYTKGKNLSASNKLSRSCTKKNCI